MARSTRMMAILILATFSSLVVIDCDLPASLLTPEAIRDMEFQSDLDDFAIRHWDLPFSPSFLYHHHPEEHTHIHQHISHTNDFDAHTPTFENENRGSQDIDSPAVSQSHQLSWPLPTISSDEEKVLQEGEEKKISEEDSHPSTSYKKRKIVEQDLLVPHQPRAEVLAEEQKISEEESHSSTSKKSKIIEEDSLVPNQPLAEVLGDGEKSRWPATYTKVKAMGNPGVDLNPEFKFVEHEETTNTAQLAVYEAIRSLKRADGSNFMEAVLDTIKPGPNTVLQIPIRRILGFLDRLRSRGMDGLGILHISRAMIYEKPDSRPFPKREGALRRRQASVKRFKAHSCQTNFQAVYVQHVMAEFEEMISKIKAEFIDAMPPMGAVTHQSAEEIERRMRDVAQGILTGSQERGRLQMNYFHRLLRILPSYLFHVDIINTLLPDKEVSTQLQRDFQRRRAGLKFFQYIQDILTRYGQVLDKSRTEKGTFDLNNEHANLFDGLVNQNPFIWKNLEYWLSIERPLLLRQVSHPLSRVLNQSFRQLINEIFVSFMDQFSKSSLTLLQ
ncbi:hypothetical protein H4Q26_003135 [Puccinia striiformis f. sp. tritici PST-130]|nr:hypothetical protein H4Q26_003135 [Puccinia striiformis f. sp. tritici PST-130]